MKQSVQTKVIAVILLLGILLIGTLSVVSNIFFSRVMEDQVMPLSKGSVRTLALNLQLHSYTYLLPFFPFANTAIPVENRDGCVCCRHIPICIDCKTGAWDV